MSVLRADNADDLVAMVGSAAEMAFESDQQVAVLLSQRFLGAKEW